MSKPLISVIMAAYNAHRFLDEAIASVCAQTRTDWELIAMDDGSTDGTFERLLEWSQKDSRIRVFQTVENSGPGFARDDAIRLAQGRYIAVMDSDDVAMVERFEKQLAFLRAHPDVIAVGSQVECIDEEGRCAGSKNFPLDPEKLHRLMYRFMPIQLPSVMMDQTKLPDGFSWFEGWPFSEDTLLFFKLAQYGKLANLPDVLLKYRQYPTSVSARIPRETFFKTHEARRRAVIEMGYQPRLSDRIIAALQYIAVSILPSFLIWKLYRIAQKGMMK